MTETATPKQELKKPPQHHSITRMTNPKIRLFACALGQHLRKCHGFDVDYSYRWVRHADGTLYFALSGSRSVQLVFADYLDSNRSNYYDSYSVTQYGANLVAFNRVFAKLLELKHGLGAYGETK